MDTEVAKVQRYDDTHIPPIPQAVIAFRSTVNELKRKILTSLEVTGNQELKNLKEAVDRIQHLGNILRSLVLTDDPEIQEAVAAAIQEGGQPDKTVDTMKTIEGVFNDAGIEFDLLDPEERALCLYYIHMDIHTYPYDLSPAHINSVSKR